MEEQQADAPGEKAQPLREKKKAPLHQRIFGREETPEIVPEKPAEAHEEELTREIFTDEEAAAPAQPETPETTTPEAAEESAEQGEMAPETDAPERPV